FNVRFMTSESLAEATAEKEAPSVIVGDLSFISLELVLPAIAEVASENSEIILLTKPQFEVGRTAVRGGLVTDPATRADAVSRVVWSGWDAGLGMRGILPSPILGTHGNAEYLVHMSPGMSGDPSQWTEEINRLAGGR